MSNITYSIGQVHDMLVGAGHDISKQRLRQFCLKIDAELVRRPHPHYRLTEAQVLEFVGRMGKRGRPVMTKLNGASE